MPRLVPGSLWETVTRAARAARAAGAIEPLATTTDYIEDGGIRFLVRMLSSLQRKAAIRQREPAVNPFLPYDPAMFVADVSDTHLCLLNRFNVVEHHILIVTRKFEAQERALGAEDFEALWACMAEYEALGFYNGGEIAGASQPHKHLQMIPLPIDPSDPTGPPLPIGPLLQSTTLSAGIDTLPGLPFPHAVTDVDPMWLREPLNTSGAVVERYRALLAAVGLDIDDKGYVPPYNLLATRQWMMLVPRSRETADHISVNALGFAGSLLVRNEEQRAFIERFGPLEILNSVAATVHPA